MGDTWIKITDWGSIKPGEELQVKYISRTTTVFIKKVSSIDSDKLNWTQDTGGWDRKKSFDNGDMILSRRAKKGPWFSKRNIDPSKPDPWSDNDTQQVIKKINNTIDKINNNYPHKCPKCGGPAYISFTNKADCSQCKG
jgi:hypothetical protein